MSLKHSFSIKQKPILCIHTLFFLITVGLSQSCFSEEIPISLETSEALTDTSDEALISTREEVDIVSDSNIAEAIARRPDLQFNNITIDGERSSIQLSDIPADAVSELEVLRAVTPDMDADSRGGSLNLSSNPTFKLEKPVIKVDAWGKYSLSEDTWMQGSSVSYSRALGDFGFRIQASQTREHDHSESFFTRWSRLDQSDTVYTPDRLFQKRFEFWDIDYHFGTAFDYRISDSLHVFARLNYSESSREAYQPRIFIRYSNGDYDVEETNSGRVTQAQVDRELTAYESQADTFDFQTGAVYNGDNWRADVRLLGEFDSYIEPDWFVIRFRTEPLDLSYALNDKQLPWPTSSSIDLNDSDNFVFDELLSERWSDDEERWVASANVRYNFEFYGIDSFFKTGVKWTRRTKDQKSDSRLYTSYDGDFSLTNVAQDYEVKSLLVDDFDWGPFPTLANSRTFSSDHFDQFEYNLKRSALKGDPATYKVNEEVSAAYAMLNMSRNRLRGILGFRVEQTKLDYNANTVIIDEDGNYLATEEQTGDNSYTDFFPSVHLRYFLGARITFISSWTGTIERPWYGDIVPYRFINFDTKDIEEGNTKLKPTLYHNFDFSFDYKLSKGSLISVELFNKEVKDIEFWEVREITSGQYKGFTLGTSKNGPTATERGLRLILTQNLSDWSESLEGFKLILKYTMQDSDTQYPNRVGEQLPVTYRPENSYEATLIYEGDKLFVQVEYTYEEAKLTSVYDHAWQDEYNTANDDLDISTSYNITDSVRLFCNINNLIRGYNKWYFGDESRPAGYNWRSKQVKFGVKLNF